MVHYVVTIRAQLNFFEKFPHYSVRLTFLLEINTVFKCLSNELISFSGFVLFKIPVEVHAMVSPSLVSTSCCFLR